MLKLDQPGLSYSTYQMPVYIRGVAESVVLFHGMKTLKWRSKLVCGLERYEFDKTTALDNRNKERVHAVGIRKPIESTYLPHP